MPQLSWSEEFELGLPLMDETHREFVELLARAGAAADSDLCAAWDELIAHTDDHFAREDEWMHSTGFAAANCHTTQHKVVLQVLREGAAIASKGNLQPVRQMINELAIWFPQHAHTMDTALAMHLRAVGFDPATGHVTMPQALPAQQISGCGGASCSTGGESRA